MNNFDSEFASVEWDNVVKVAVLKWKKYASGVNFQEPCKAALNMAIAKKATRWYSDTKLLGVIKSEDTDWFMKEIVQGMLKYGVKKQALIVPESAISKMCLNRAGDTAKDIGLETNFFSSSQQAMIWLKS